MIKLFGKETKSGRARPKLTIDAKIGLVIFVFFGLVAVFAPLLAPNHPADIISFDSFVPPGTDGLILGGDYLGRDLFSRLVHGARLTIGLAFAATVVGFIIGILLGFVAAELGGWMDNAISSVIDILISFPPILLALVIIAGLGSSLIVLVLTVALIHASRVARIARAMAMDIATNDFVEVARLRGESLWYLLRKEIWPNATRTLAAEFGLRLTFSVLFLSALSFLGLGIQPPNADWGLLVRENMPGLLYGSWSALLPAGAIALITIGINLLVDWIIRQTGRGMSEEMS